jgi:hypothetical protein
MYKCLAIIAGTLALLAGSMLAPERAEARGGTIATLKDTHTSQVHQPRTTRQAQRSGFGITEYSSSSARSPSQKH